MSSVSMSGGCSAALFSSLQQPRAAETDRTQQLFSKMDLDGDGTVGASELASFANEISERTGTKIDADSMLTSLDSDGNGSVSSTELSENARTLFDELRAQLTSSQLQPRLQPPDPEEMFGQMDADGNGSISRTELNTFLGQRAAGTGFGPDAADILARDDADADGSISSDEFKTAMQRDSSGPPRGSSKDDAIGRLLASLIEQYGSSSKEGIGSSTALSVVA